MKKSNKIIRDKLHLLISVLSKVYYKGIRRKRTVGPRSLIVKLMQVLIRIHSFSPRNKNQKDSW
jgi:hypothetical protein